MECNLKYFLKKKGIKLTDSPVRLFHSLKPTARLQSVAKPGQIILSEESYQKVIEFFKCLKVGEVTMKNKANPMVIYQVIE